MVQGGVQPPCGGLRLLLGELQPDRRPQASPRNDDEAKAEIESDPPEISRYIQIYDEHDIGNCWDI